MSKNSNAFRYFLTSATAFCVFLLSILTVSALTVTLSAPGDLTFNNTQSRNINFSFTPMWSFTGELVSNCSLYTTASGSWAVSRLINVSNFTESPETSIQNNTLSYANFTFTADGNYTWNIGCLNTTSGPVNLTFGTNRTVVVDKSSPRINVSFSAASGTIKNGDTFNFSSTSNISDNIGLATVTISNNMTGTLRTTTFSASGTLLSVSNITTISGKGGDVINFSMIVTDTSGNSNISSNLLTIETTAPTILPLRPNGTNAINQTVSTFTLNLSVSSDASACLYEINTTGNSSGSGTGNRTMTFNSADNTCVGDQEESFFNLYGIYNITFVVNDTSNNVARLVFFINVSDREAPKNPNGTYVSLGTPSSSGVTITISNMNESVNATVFYGNTLASQSTLGDTESDFSKSQSLSLSSLSASTTYFLNITVCDYVGNCAYNNSFNFTTDAEAVVEDDDDDDSGGSSGGGGGAVSTNTVATTGHAWSEVAAGETKSMTVNNAKIAVLAIKYTADEALKGVNVDVSTIKNAPYQATPSSKVYQYLEIKAPKLSAKASDITISFSVTNTWLASNGASEDSIKLYRYADGKWNELATTKSSSDATKTTFSAVTPGFSYFAVGVTSGSTAAPLAEDTPAETSSEAQSDQTAAETTSQPTPTEATAEENVSEGTVEAQGWKRYSMPIGIAVGLLIIVIIVVLMQRGKKDQAY